MRKEEEKNSNGDTVAIYTVFSSVEWHCEQTSAQTVGHQQWPLSSSRGAKEVRRPFGALVSRQRDGSRDKAIVRQDS